MEENKPLSIWDIIWRTLKSYFDVQMDREGETKVVEEIRSKINFRGANLWVLIFAIFIASLGLNVNSTAVVIGAMLISPLMGPIIGVGLGIGIGDLRLLKNSVKNYLVATGISILTATVYFLITPLTEVSSEILARTSPTLYDVLIALCGGAAGILALSTKDKGNVIPGVAIATALMPPLCSAGYGLAVGQLPYFFGAAYLFFINSVFICLATFLGVKMMKFRRVNELDIAMNNKFRSYAIIVLIVTMIPATFITVDIIKNSILDNNMSRFVREQMSFTGTQILSSEIDKKNKEIHLVAIGQEISQKNKQEAQSRLDEYNLAGYKIGIIQGSQSDSLLNADMKRIQREADQKLLAQASHSQALERQLNEYTELESVSVDVARELNAIYPEVESISIAKVLESQVDTTLSEHKFNAVIKLKDEMLLEEEKRNSLAEWLSIRCKLPSLNLIVAE